MSTYRILIVEDELLIANTIKRYLQKQNYEVTGIAISYDEAIQLYNTTHPDLTLLDIRLNGAKTGIDVANYIRHQDQNSSYIYLTSQADQRSIAAATNTAPSGYLTKPIRKTDLMVSVQLVLQNQVFKQPKKLKIGYGNNLQTICVDHILYLEADHVYVKIHLNNGRTIMHRGSIVELLTQLPPQQFLQTHRSFAVNTAHVDQYDTSHLYIRQRSIPLGRSRRKDVIQTLNEL
ncbi:MAG: response regulator transcription factor [Bacteroidota bacterium]